jgi:hypothetical protein
MTVPYGTFLALGLAAGMLGAGYIFASGAAALPDAPGPKSAPIASVAANPAPGAAPAAPTAKPTGTLVVNRAPVPLVPRTHDTYYAVQTASATPGPARGATATDGAAVGGMGGAAIDGGLPPAADDGSSGDGAQARKAIEFDGYKNVRGLTKGPDGMWRGRAMRGRTEITVRVDASGSVSAE